MYSQYTFDPPVKTTKHCHSCDTDKPVSEFYKNKRSRDGLASACKACADERNRRWREANPDKWKAALRKQARKYHDSPTGYFKQLARRMVHLRYPPVDEVDCFMCGAQAAHYHHVDYDEPLIVAPLCTACHAYVHTLPWAPD